MSKHSALKKTDFENSSYPLSEEFRRRIAQQAEEACHIPGNINGPDLDDAGLSPRARMRLVKRSDFA